MTTQAVKQEQLGYVRRVDVDLLCQIGTIAQERYEGSPYYGVVTTICGIAKDALRLAEDIQRLDIPEATDNHTPVAQHVLLPGAGWVLDKARELERSGTVCI